MVFMFCMIRVGLYCMMFDRGFGGKCGMVIWGGNVYDDIIDSLS